MRQKHPTSVGCILKLRAIQLCQVCASFPFFGVCVSLPESNEIVNLEAVEKLSPCTKCPENVICSQIEGVYVRHY